MARKKYFTPKDVDGLIPRLESVFEHIEQCKVRIEALSSVRDDEPTGDFVARSRMEFWLEAVEDNVNLIAQLGGVTKDLEEGLVDFPGQMDGEPVWLCWRRGEPHLRYWHPVDQGFEQRQTLPRSDAPTTRH